MQLLDELSFNQTGSESKHEEDVSTHHRAAVLEIPQTREIQEAFVCPVLLPQRFAWEEEVLKSRLEYHVWLQRFWFRGQSLLVTLSMCCQDIREQKRTWAVQATLKWGESCKFRLYLTPWTATPVGSFLLNILKKSQVGCKAIRKFAAA